jgi:hypothetical protein
MPVELVVDEVEAFTTRLELREWLAAHHATETACWVRVSIKPQPDTILYLDAVEEALCFGWIDGVKKKVSDSQLAQRLSPRQRRGNWTQLNKERVRRLEKLGLMTDVGRACLPDMAEGAFQVHPFVMAEIEKDAETLANFLGFPPLYRRVRVDTIQSELTVYNRPALFESRLARFVESTRQGKMYGRWHDDGRLLDY